MIVFLFFKDNRLWHFLQILSLGDNLYKMSKPTFWEKWEKYFKMSFTEITVIPKDTFSEEILFCCEYHKYECKEGVWITSENLNVFIIQDENLMIFTEKK